MARWSAGLLRRCFLVLMLLGSALITAASLVYFDTDILPPFVLEKLPLRFKSLWLAALRVHVATALFTFPACLALMTRTIQRRPQLHRWLGRVTGALVLFALVPSGAVLAFDAKGGSVVTVGFLLSAVSVAIAMVAGIAAARRRDLVAHRRAAWHVVAQMSVAVTSRALLIGFDSVGVDPELAYVIALWLPVVASAAVVELIASRSLFSRSTPSVERNRREHPALALLPARSVLRPLTRLGR